VPTELEIILEKIAFHTLGCRLNFAESGEMATTFKQKGYKIVSFGEKADLIVINTCTVTDRADATCRNIIRKAYKGNPEAKIAIVGCYAQMEPEKLLKMEGVDIVLGSSEKHKLISYLEEEKNQLVNIERNNEFWCAATSENRGQTRAFLKIQDGCDYFCSYCIIPFARGRSKAVEAKYGLNKAKEIITNGFKEIVLTGVNIGEYESNSGEKLTTLISKILEIRGLERLRLSSIEANTVSDDLLTLAKYSPKFMPHFHIPLQSGDDTILKLMKRKYDRTFYKQTIERIITAIPHAAIGADIITGFPGESEKMFQNSYNFMNQLPITHFHVFPYSMRKNTAAAKMEGHIQHKIKKFRAKELTLLGEKKLEEFQTKQIGKVKKVLFETKRKEGIIEGYTEDFLKVQVLSNTAFTNQIKPILIESVKNHILQGKSLT
jgi:threonylcarbamoyladenosine tRNA methylthiotransferase MtaB